MNSLLIASLAGLVTSAAVLVLVFRSDERLDRTFNREWRWLHPAIDRIQSIVRLSIRMGVSAALIAVATLFAWNSVASRIGWSRVPIPVVKVHLSELGRYTLFNKVALGWVVILVAMNLARCLTTPLFDIFISYKSEDVVLARRIADELIGAGWRVWFAEYQVLLQRCERFQFAILQGIFNSQFGLAITNNRWAQSEYCSFEIKKLLESLGPQMVLELRLPSEDLPHRHNPALHASPFLESNDVSEVLRFVEKSTGVPVPVASPVLPPANGRQYRATCGGRPCSLLVDGWTLHENGKASDGSLKGRTFRYNAAEEAKLFVDLYSGPELSRQVRRVDQTINDREMFDALMEWAPTHLDRVVAKVRGVHLLFHSGLCQMAITYWICLHVVDGPTGPARVGDYWSRKVSIIIPNPVTNQMAEFVFTFGFHGTFAEYCRYAHVMDAFALSLNWS